ncbi:hypothetical protein CKO11_12685 [Rhodobacter sp. TJ_12]|uniref:PepSY domain-containing protein n=1 Tax=Rhodobacter sp. TJ_12 TaxID=2029399 RepID=UPI001CBFB301|nr:PepSY domain-containing protein [Rhodobacter sp. TJ_12]MBZ4023315.1 hypothetical protein [Rhodobacter sp. TJ_12]
MTHRLPLPLPLPLLLAALALAGPLAAHERHCTVPLADWQPRAAVQSALEAQGLAVMRIKIDDGCYEVDARDATGQRLWLRLDPASLEVLRQAIPHRRHDDDEDDDADDDRRSHDAKDHRDRDRRDRRLHD